MILSEIMVFYAIPLIFSSCSIRISATFLLKRKTPFPRFCLVSLREGLQLPFPPPIVFPASASDGQLVAPADHRLLGRLLFLYEWEWEKDSCKVEDSNFQENYGLNKNSLLSHTVYIGYFTSCHRSWRTAFMSMIEYRCLTSWIKHHLN